MGFLTLGTGFVCFVSPWNSFPPVGLPYPASVLGLLSCLFVYCFVMFSYCLLEASLFHRETEQRGVSKGKQGGVLEEWGDGKLS